MTRTHEHRTKGPAQRDPDVDIDLAFHEREWRIQRIGWLAILAILIMALAGVFGDGPLSKVRVGDASEGTVDYERYTRDGARTAIIVTLPARADQAAAHIAINADYLQVMRIESITPEPASVKLKGDAVVYEFERGPLQTSIMFRLEPEHIGSHRAQIRIGANAPLELRQFTYP